MTVTPYTPQQFLQEAKEQQAISDKVSLLRRLIQAFPLDANAVVARENLVSLLAGSNRYEEALQEYQEKHPKTGAGNAIDFQLIEYLLKTGRYGDVLRATSAASGPIRDFTRDEKLLELRVQALLARGQYGVARECVDRWLADYAGDDIPGSRFEGDIRGIQFLRRHLMFLERTIGPKGKAIFTASVPDSLQHWSHRREVPLYIYKLVPAHPAGQLYEPMLPGRHEADDYFENLVDQMNRGFDYLSGGEFSLSFKGVDTLYVKEGDMDPTSTGGNILTSRVYVHTIPELYRLSGDAFVMLVDYRAQSEGEAAYMGDGLIHISASKLQILVMMHEVLHGLGATHQEWNYLQGQGYRFDPDDRGLMTFEKGELTYLGLEEKNRAVLGWPHVAVVRLSDDTPLAAEPAADTPDVVASSDLLPKLN